MRVLSRHDGHQALAHGKSAEKEAFYWLYLIRKRGLLLALLDKVSNLPSRPPPPISRTTPSTRPLPSTRTPLPYYFLFLQEQLKGIIITRFTRSAGIIRYGHPSSSRPAACALPSARLLPPPHPAAAEPAPSCSCVPVAKASASSSTSRHRPTRAPPRSCLRCKRLICLAVLRPHWR
jgi:hypothetical protein